MRIHGDVTVIFGKNIVRHAQKLEPIVRKHVIYVTEMEVEII